MFRFIYSCSTFAQKIHFILQENGKKMGTVATYKTSK